jgi:F0F1-type ATP synthase membrane subunit b/b'
LLDELRTISEANIEAKKIIETATAQAEKIKSEAKQRGLVVYEEAYNEIIKQARQEAVSLKEQAKGSVDKELKELNSKADEQTKEIGEIANKNFNAAVDIVLNEFYNEK